MFAAFGAEVITVKGEMNVRSDAVRHVLDCARQLMKHSLDDAVSYDDASNHRALISGQSAMIWNPPSARAVAQRDAPTVALGSWTFPAPKGPYPMHKSHDQESCIAIAPGPPWIAGPVYNRGTLPAMLAKLKTDNRSRTSRIGLRTNSKASRVRLRGGSVAWRRGKA